jgi:hypothetical protein
MSISSFDDVLRLAREQSQPQRLLFVFANAVLPDDATPEQRARFDAGKGGALTPLMSVDKAPEELGTFDALVEESRQYGRDWAIVFVARWPCADKQGSGPVASTHDRVHQDGFVRIVHSVRPARRARAVQLSPRPGE